MALDFSQIWSVSPHFLCLPVTLDMVVTLGQWLSTFLMFWFLNTEPHVVVTAALEGQTKV